MATGRYDHLSLPETISSSLISSERWEDKKIDPECTFKVGLNREKKDLITIIKSFFNSMSNNKCTSTTGKEAVIIAHYLYDNLSTDLVPLRGDEYTDGSVEMEYVVPSAAAEVGKHTVRKTITKSREKTDEEKELNADQLREKGLIANPYEQNKVSFQTEEDVEEQISGSTSGETDYSDAQLRFFVFMGTFCCKIITKGESNLERSWPNGIKYYEKFYIGQDGATTVPTPKNAWITGLKAQFHTNINLSKSIVRLTVHLEKTLAPETSQAGMTRYLLCLPLSYGGMHAYKLFLAVKHCSGLGTKYLLEKLVCPINIPALDSIADILMNYETVNNIKKSPSFKYARSVGPQYFQSLQTKSCPALVYCLVMLLKKYEGGSSTFSPDNIVGISQLGSEIRAQMEAGANLIFKTPPPDSTGMYSDIFKQVAFSTTAPSTSTNPPLNPYRI